MLEVGLTGQGSVLDLIDQLKQTVSTAKGVLLSENCMVHRQQFLQILDQITVQLPEELERAQWIVREQRKVELSAHQEAEQIIMEAENRAVQMINEHDITQQAQAHAESIVAQAEQESQEIEHQTIQYVQNKLYELDEKLTQILLDIRRDAQTLE